jgi:hypothetical protein
MLTQYEQALVDAVLRERDEPMVHIEARLQQNRATQLAEIVTRLTCNERLYGTCTWKYDDTLDYYDADCGFAWQSGVGGSPEEHGVGYCHKCGRRIVVKMPEYQEEESDETVV